MEKLIKDFKSLSKFIGIISLYHVYNLVSYLVDFSNVDLSTADAMTQQFMPVVKVISVLPFVLSILVHLFLCFRGLREANDPSSAKFHIILAIIWTLGYAFGAIGTGIELFGGANNVLVNVINLLFNAAMTVLLFFYSKFAAQVRGLEKEKKNSY